MKSQRQLQVGEQIKRIIAEIFSREGLSVISGVHLTILEADVSPDIKNVRIYLDMFGNDKNHDAILDKLNSGAAHFRHELGKKMTSRNTPEIRFVLDKTGAFANHIEALIDMEAKAMAEPVKKSTPKPRKKKS